MDYFSFTSVFVSTSFFGYFTYAYVRHVIASDAAEVNYYSAIVVFFLVNNLLYFSKLWKCRAKWMEE
jgi:hypothetical protein